MIVSTSQQSSAYEVTFKPLGFEFEHSPTICALEPKDSGLSSTQIKKLLDQARISTSEWDAKLKSAEKNRDKKDNWNLNYVVIDDRNQSDCDVTIVFKEKYEKPIREHGILGLADPDPINDTWEISLYYLQVQKCYESGYIGSQRYYWYASCFSDDLKTSEQVGSIIRHELGHAFGLGHYKADDYFVNEEWAKGQQPAKSIMTMIEPEFVKESKIRDLDVQKLREIYGENGFLPDQDAGGFNLFKAEWMNEKEFYNEAIAYTDKFLNSNPNDEDILYQIGLAVWGLDNYDQAESIMDKVIEINPEHDDALYTKAKAITKKKDYEQALDTLDKVLEINPEHDKAISYKGKIYKIQENYDEAAKSFDEAYEINSFNEINLNRRGYLELDILGNAEKALWNFNRALDIEPDYDNALYGKATALLDLEEFERAIKYYDKYLKINPDDPDALYNKALSLDELGRSDEAQTLFDEVEKIESTESEQEVPTIVEIPTQEEQIIVETPQPQIPNWIRNNAEWWAQGAIGDSDFVGGIQYLIKEDIIQIPETTSTTTASESNEIPSWIKNNADWWSQGLISDDDFVKGIQYLIEQGIISI